MCYVCISPFYNRIKQKIIAILAVFLIQGMTNQVCYKLHALISNIILGIVYAVPVKNAPISKLHHSIQTMAIPDTASLINCDQFNKLSVVQPKWPKINSCNKHHFFMTLHRRVWNWLLLFCDWISLWMPNKEKMVVQ